MSFVGKILVVVQVILSIVFMAFAGSVAAVQTNWKAEHGKISDQLKKRNADYATLESDHKKSVDDRASAEAALKDQTTKAQADNVVLNAKLQTLQSEYDSLKTAATSKGEISLISAEEAQARRVETLMLRELYKKALEGKDAEFRAKNALEDQNFELRVELEKLKRDYVALLKENGKFKEVLLANKLPYQLDDYEKKAAPPPDVTGKVLETRKKGQTGSEYVEISLGSDDGLQTGHQLYVYSSAAGNEKAKYLGKIEIVYTTPDKAVGTVMDKVRNGIINRGDNVTTKL